MVRPHAELLVQDMIEELSSVAKVTIRVTGAGLISIVATASSHRVESSES